MYRESSFFPYGSTSACTYGREVAVPHIIPKSLLQSTETVGRLGLSDTAEYSMSRQHLECLKCLSCKSFPRGVVRAFPYHIDDLPLS